MKALIVVDVQYDFCPGGNLAVKDGDEIIPIINELLPEYDLVIFTQDWHPKNMDCFAETRNVEPFSSYINKDGNEDTVWPRHCVADTYGADIHRDIKLDLIKGEFYFFKKGLTSDKHPYSGFGADGLTEFLKEKEVSEVDIVGLATDYCCKETALDAVKEGFKTNFIWDATRGIADDLSNTMTELFENDVIVVDSDYLLNNGN